MELTLELKIIWVCAVGPSELHAVDLDALKETVISACTSHYRQLWVRVVRKLKAISQLPAFAQGWAIPHTLVCFLHR